MICFLLLQSTTIGKVGIYKSDEPSIACADLLTIRLKDERLAEIIHFFCFPIMEKRNKL